MALLFAMPFFLAIPQAHAAVTTNPALTAGSANASAFGNQRTVYYVQYVASPLSYRWWVFYATGSGILYQSSTNGKVWSAQATLTALGNSGYGGAFSAYLSGNNLYYALASAAGNTLYYGEVNLAASGAATSVTSGSLTTTNAMTATSPTSIVVDSNGYTWISVATAGTVEVWACKGALGSCSWMPQGAITGSSTFALNSGSPSSELLNVGSSVALLFVNPATASAYGIFDIYYLVSAGTGYVSWVGPKSPSSVFYQENYFSAVVSGSTIYVTGDMAGFVDAFYYTLSGLAVSTETAVISTLPGTYQPTLSLSGGTLVMAYPTGSSVAYYTAPLPGTTWTLASNLTPPRYIAQNTENAPAYVTSTEGDNGTSIPSIGYLWTNSGGQMRFSSLDVTPVPVSVTLSMTEYVFHTGGAVETGKVSPTNYYTISYWACSPSCTSPTVSTQQYTSSTGAPLTISNVVSQTPVTISGTSSSSSSTQEWCLNQSCSPTIFGASDGVTTSWYYFDLLAETTMYTIVGGSAPSSPTIIYDGAPGASGNSPTFAAYSAPMSTSSVNYWMLRNSTDSATAAIAGLPNEQWAAGGVGDTTSWTVTSPNLITPNIKYYHQYDNTYTFNLAGSATAFPSGTQFQLAVTLYGAASTYSFTGTGVAGPMTQNLWTDAGQTVTFPLKATAGVPAGTRWMDSTGSAYTTPVISSGGNPPFSQSYYEQYSQILQYGTKDGSVLSVSQIPQITYTSLGVISAHTLNTTSNTDYIDAGTTATVPGHIYGGSGERWVTTSSTWSITKASVIPDPIIYYHQFQQQVFYTTNDGIAIPAGSVPIFKYTNNNTAQSWTLTGTARLLYADAVTTATVPGQICVGSCGTATHQWVTSPSSWAITGYMVVDPSSSGAVPYFDQYLISFAVSPSGTGSTSPPTGTSVWETTLTPFAIIGSPAVNYAFSDWSTVAGITIASTSSASTTSSVTGSGTITANFILQSGLQFTETGLNLAAGLPWTVTITADPLNACPVGGGPLPCNVTSTTSGIFLSGVPVGPYSYSVPSPQPWTPGTQYLVTFVTNGNPGTVAVNPSSNVAITFQAQYYLTVNQNPTSSGTITANGVNCALTPAACWFTSGATVNLVATATAPGAVWADWTTALACAPNCNNAAMAIVMPTNPATVTANFNVPISLVFSPSSSATSGLGSTVLVTVTVTGGGGPTCSPACTITMSNSPPSGLGIAVSFTPTTFTPSATGVSTTMTITISPSAPLPVYTFDAIATDNAAPVHTAQSLFTLFVISPTASQVGFSTNPYAITYASQTALFSEGGDWFTFYSDGTNLVYSASGPNPAGPWTTQNVITSPPYPYSVPGYSFAVSNSGTSVYLAVISTSYPGGFLYATGTISGAVITWWPGGCVGSCVNVGGTRFELLPITNLETTACTSATCKMFSAGSPSIMVDTSASPATIWFAIPAVYSTGVAFNWHIELITMTGPLSYTTPNYLTPADIRLGPLNASSVTSAVHAQLYSMQDGVAVTFAVGNTPDIPRVVMFNHNSPYAFIGTFCPSITCSPNSIMGAGWSLSGPYFFEQQSQATAQTGTDNLFFAGLARTSSVVGATADYFSFAYNPVTKIGNFSSPTNLNAVYNINSYALMVDNSWHVSILYSSPNLYVSLGVDNDLSFMIGTVNPVHTAGDAPQVVWTATPTPVSGASNIVGGVTMASSGSTVGVVWVEYIPGASHYHYRVQFAVV